MINPYSYCFNFYLTQEENERKENGRHMLSYSSVNLCARFYFMSATKRETKIQGEKKKEKKRKDNKKKKKQ